jgi:hypothetical protein
MFGDLPDGEPSTFCGDVEPGDMISSELLEECDGVLYNITENTPTLEEAYANAWPEESCEQLFNPNIDVTNPPTVIKLCNDLRSEDGTPMKPMDEYPPECQYWYSSERSNDGEFEQGGG